MKIVNPFYTTAKWKAKASKIKRRDGYQCQECKRYGKTSAAEQVHHINPLEDYPYLAWENDNLLSLCNACHNKMHNREDHSLTSFGLRWVKKVEVRIKKKYKSYIPPT